jgi:hypothetical protein
MFHVGFHPELKRAYREYCEQMCLPGDLSEFQRWIDEFNEVAEEDHAAAVEAYWAEQRRYLKDGV